MAATTVVVGDPSPDVQVRALGTQSVRIAADLDALRAAILLITAKLDADGGVTDTNYAALCDPAAITTAAVTLQGS